VKRADLLAMAGDLFSMVAAGKVKADVRQTFPLAAAADAHRALESRATTGATLLIP
jgi:NADPH2:quinone reductase